ncbi:MAG: imidazole glycerol phosphate synthase subunit HisF [Flavobacteriales bacterium]|nr:imidazole glycerol phosphate synthase subunit HisF [Flavobacteriales bacterium]
MLAKRIIPCLDIKDGQCVKGIGFEGLRVAGDPVELAVEYCQQGADELVFLDISATEEKRKTVVKLVDRLASEMNIPFTVGGGIKSVEDVDAILKAGADKVSINSSALQRPELINELAAVYGSQCVVVAIDAKLEGDSWNVYSSGGKQKTKKELFSWAKEVEQRGAGEILFTSINHDGSKKGYAIETLNQLAELVNIPVIASGGAGCEQDFVDLFINSQADAALAASVFHYGQIDIPTLKKNLKQHKIQLRYGA